MQNGYDSTQLIVRFITSLTNIVLKPNQSCEDIFIPRFSSRTSLFRIHITFYDLVGLEFDEIMDIRFNAKNFKIIKKIL